MVDLLDHYVASDFDSVVETLAKHPALTVTARRTRATLAFVMPSMPGSVPLTVPTGGSTRTMTILPGQPAGRPVNPLLASLARETGGTILPGYHTPEVSVTRDGATVLARRGYFGG